jgi:hypothetical protein
MRKQFGILGVVCAGLALVACWAASMWPTLTWYAGFVCGLSVAFFVALRSSPPAWIENWQDGAWGEEWTAKALKGLETEGWVVLHDVPAAGGNFDHVAVGPGGVFLLDSKRLRGTVRVEREQVHVERLESPDLHYRHPGIPGLLGLAREAHDRIRAETKISVWVQPTMVIWGEFGQRVVDGRCCFVHGDEVAAWLLGQPVRIAPQRLQQVIDAVRLGLNSELPST